MCDWTGGQGQQCYGVPGCGEGGTLGSAADSHGPSLEDMVEVWVFSLAFLGTDAGL